MLGVESLASRASSMASREVSRLPEAKVGGPP